MMNNIGELLKNKRKELNLTLEDVGNAVGVGKATVQKWETGMIQNMRSDKIENLAKILQLDPVQLVPRKTPIVVRKDDPKDDVTSKILNDNQSSPKLTTEQTRMYQALASLMKYDKDAAVELFKALVEQGVL